MFWVSAEYLRDKTNCCQEFFVSGNTISTGRGGCLYMHVTCMEYREGEGCYIKFSAVQMCSNPPKQNKTKKCFWTKLSKNFKRGSLSTLHACVYVYIWQLSSFRAPTLTVTTCHIQYTFLTLCKGFSWENRQNTEILEVCHYRMIQKWALPVIRCAILGEPL